MKKLPDYLKEETQRNTKLTNFISVGLFLIAMVIGTGYFFSSVTEHLHYKLWIGAFLFVIPFLFNKYGYNNTSRFILSILPVVIAMFLSINSKADAINSRIINPVNYFDVRIILLCVSVIPLFLFSIKEKKMMFGAMIPSYLALIFFDPIHNAFGVGYYQAGVLSPDYYFSVNLFTIITLLFFTTVILTLKRQVLKSDYRQTSENEQTRLYLAELVKISNSKNVNDGNVEAAKKEIITTVKRCLSVSRVSIWEFNKKEESITCQYLIDDQVESCPGTVLYAKDYPTYFVELKYQQLIIARDARNDPKTDEFTEDYLIPSNIYSMMDAPYLKKGELGGVICCEHQGEYKQWGAAESLVLKALGDFLSYAIIVNDRLKQNQLLQEKNLEISRINENLESIVKSRTKELEEKNKQLTEYAYINSHVLKAPVARISGLYNIFRMETTGQIKDPSILSHMEGSIEELQLITTQINQAIEDNGIINRDHLNKN